MQNHLTMLKIIDIYIIKKYLGTFVFALGIFCSISIVFDLADKFEEFMRKGATFQQILFGYYPYYVPYIINLLSSLFTFIVVVYFTSKMSKNFEFIAMLSSGISFWRILVPYLVSAFVIALASWTLNTYIIPAANEVRFDFEENYYRDERYRNKDFSIHRQISANTFMYVQRFDNYNNTGYFFSLEKIVDNRLVSKMIADSVCWDSASEKWRAYNYMIRNIENYEEKIISGKMIDTAISIHPLEFGIRKENYAESLNRPQLNSFIELQLTRGENVNQYLIEKYRRFAAPFSVFILTIIGISLATKKIRGGVGAHIAFGLMISFVYILALRISSTMAIDSNMNPLLAVWIPNMVFGVVAFILLLNANK